jgi:hypothetical protein
MDAVIPGVYAVAEVLLSRGSSGIKPKGEDTEFLGRVRRQLDGREG